MYNVHVAYNCSQSNVCRVSYQISDCLHEFHNLTLHNFLLERSAGMLLARLKAEKVGFLVKAFLGNELNQFSRQIVSKSIRRYTEFRTRIPNFGRFLYQISDTRKMCRSVKLIFIVKLNAQDIRKCIFGRMESA